MDGIRREVAFRNNSEVFSRLAEVANVATPTPEERNHYEATGNLTPEEAVKYSESYFKELDNQSSLRFAAKKNREEGRKEGLKEGRKEGREEGKKEGRKEEKKDIARKMLEGRLNVEMIASFTGLSESEIMSL